MAPTFALDLSLDGIRLLYRAEGGWTVVGDVAVEDPALADRLAALRAEAESIAPGALSTELVIPPSQIRYAAIPRPRAGEVAEADIRPALDGLTALPPEDLAFDWEVDGDTVHLALVDRLTLAEAEAFAEAHRFNPVCFGARPTPAQFPRAPRFGTTARAASTAPVPAAADPAAPAPAPLTAPPEPAPPPPVAAANTLSSPPAPPLPETIGAEALARSLSAPRPGDRPAAPRPAPSRSLPRPGLPGGRRLALAAGGGLAAALALALLFGYGDGADPAASLSDIPPEVALAPPVLAAPVTAEAAPLSPVAPDEEAPAATAAAAVEPPEPAEDPAADTAAPAALPEVRPEPQVLRLAQAPVLTVPPRATPEATEEIYLASIDPVTRTSDAIALVPAESFPIRPGRTLPLPPSAAGASADPAPAEAEATAPPEAVVVTVGRPPRVPPAAPARDTAAAPEAEAEAPPEPPEADVARSDPEAAPEPTALASALPDRKPRARPAGLVERNERAILGGRTRAEMAALRPLERPASEQAQAAAAAPAPPTQFAVASSRLPRGRPADLATRVATANAIAAALAAAPPAPAPAPAPVVAAAPAAAPAPAPTPPPAAAAAPADLPYDDGEPDVVAAAPNIPTSASVARQATIRNAMVLRQINLIGVYGTDRDRRALVRLPSGRYVKVKVGDSLDGGQIAAIGRDQLRYVKGGRNITLTIPSG